MTRLKSHKIPISVLRKLESEIRKELPEHLSVVYELSDLLQVSKESIYRRLRGITAFTLDELWLLFESYGLSIDSLFTVWSKNQFSVRFVNVSDHGVEAFYHKVKAVFKEVLHEGSFKIYSISAQIPLSYLIEKAFTLQFKQTMWRHKYEDAIKGQDVKVGDMLYNSHKYSPVRHEIWSVNATNQILKELEYALSCGLKFSDDFLYGFFQNLLEIIDEVIFPKSNQDIVLYQQEIDVRMNIVISFGKQNNICVQFGDDMIGVASGGNDMTNLQKWVDTVLNQSIRITGQSGRQKRNFHLRLTEPIYAMAKSKLSGDLTKKLRAENEVVQVFDA